MNYFDFKESIESLLDEALEDANDEEKVSIIHDFKEACDDACDYAFKVEEKEV